MLESLDKVSDWFLVSIATVKKHKNTVSELIVETRVEAIFSWDSFVLAIN